MATLSEYMMFDMCANADTAIAEIGIEQVNVLQGAFMNMFILGGGAVDLEKGTIGFFGDGNRPVELTSVEDTARIVARVAPDRTLKPGKFAVARDHVSFR